MLLVQGGGHIFHFVADSDILLFCLDDPLLHEGSHKAVGPTFPFFGDGMPEGRFYSLEFA